MLKWGVAIAMLLPAGGAWAQFTVDDYRERVSKADFEAPAGAGQIGEQLDLYTGKLRFTQYDVDLQGEGLPIRVGRWLAVGDTQFSAFMTGDFGSWNLVMPMITTLAATDLEPNGRDEWIVARLRDANAFKRCSAFATPPSAGTRAGPSVWWYGVSLHDGAGGEEFVLKREAATRLPAPSLPIAGVSDFPLLTKSGWLIGCLPSTSNSEPGEGFLAVDPQGTKYWMDHMVYREHYPFHDEDPETSTKYTRNRAMALPSRIEDKFGNSLAYHYGPFGVTSIASSDGRRVEMEWLAMPLEEGQMPYGVISKIHVVGDDGRRRTYTYEYKTKTEIVAITNELVGVNRPDGATWAFAVDAFLYGPAKMPRSNACMPDEDLPRSGSVSVRSPSGLSASYTLSQIRHGNSNAPNACYDKGFSMAWSVTKASYGGAGVNFSRLYSYEFARSFADACGSACSSSKRTFISNPDGTSEIYAFNNLYRGIDEGVLEQKDTLDPSASLVRRELYRYSGGDGQGTYRAGSSLIKLDQYRGSANILRYEQGRFPSSRVVQEGGYDYVMSVDAADVQGRPLVVSRYSPWHSRRDATSYHDDLTAWVLGSVGSETNLNTGIVVSQVQYGPNAVPMRRFNNGRLDESYLHDARGNVEATEDGRRNATLYGAWKRGVPLRVTYADDSVHSASLDSFGQISTVTNEASSTKSYRYDLMGRLSGMSYPAGDGVAWSDLQQAWEMASSPEIGLGEAHWRRSKANGNLREITHYDAMMRPVLEHRYDIADVAGTSIYTRYEYDYRGMQTFESYPSADSSAPLGTRKTYDGVGRLTSVSVDSELGVLTNRYEYLPGSQLRLTDAKGIAVTSGYQVFDQPSYELPVWIHGPGTITNITRDVFGKPTEIRREN